MECISNILSTEIKKLKNENNFLEQQYIFNTGLRDLDYRLGGMKPGELIVIGSRPVIGKTSLALQIAYNLCSNTNCPVYYFSNELTLSELSLHLLSTCAHINTSNMRKKIFTNQDFENIEKTSIELSKLPLYLDDTNGYYIEKIINKCRQLIEKESRSVIIIDYLQLIKTEEIVEDRLLIGKFMSELKSLARELNCLIILLSQLNRDVEHHSDKRPFLKNLKGSDAIETIADIVLLLYRDEVYHPDTEEPGVMEIMIAKNKEGDIGTTKMKWVGIYRKCEDLY